MAFPYSKKVTFEAEDKIWSDRLKLLTDKFEGKGLAGLEYEWKVVRYTEKQLVVEISSKSAVTVIIVAALAGAIIPGLDIKFFLLYAAIVSLLLYFLLFSIFSAEVFRSLTRYLTGDTTTSPVRSNCSDCCPACGAPITPDDVFCPSCGLRVKQNKFTTPLDTSKYATNKNNNAIRYIYTPKNQSEK